MQWLCLTACAGEGRGRAGLFARGRRAKGNTCAREVVRLARRASSHLQHLYFVPSGALLLCRKVFERDLLHDEGRLRRRVGDEPARAKGATADLLDLGVPGAAGCWHRHGRAAFALSAFGQSGVRVSRSSVCCVSSLVKRYCSGRHRGRSPSPCDVKHNETPSDTGLKTRGSDSSPTRQSRDSRHAVDANRPCPLGSVTAAMRARRALRAATRAPTPTRRTMTRSSSSSSPRRPTLLSPRRQETILWASVLLPTRCVTSCLSSTHLPAPFF